MSSVSECGQSNEVRLVLPHEEEMNRIETFVLIAVMAGNDTF